MSALHTAARKDAKATRAQHNARDTLRTEVQTAINNGMSEAETARHAGVTRITIRKWIGKDGAK